MRKEEFTRPAPEVAKAAPEVAKAAPEVAKIKDDGKAPVNAFSGLEVEDD